MAERMARESLQFFFWVSNEPGQLRAELVLSSRPVIEEVKFFSHTSTIFGLELSAIVLGIFHSRASLRNRAIVIYTDNNAALAALINGDSSVAAFSLIAVFWFLAAAYNIAIWLERVGAKRNIADPPTRGLASPFILKERKISRSYKKRWIFTTSILRPTLRPGRI